MRLLSISLVVCASMLAGFAAQERRATGAAVSGTIVDAAGQGLPGATVSLTRRPAKPITTATDSAGAFRFADVPAGTYQLKASLAGFVTASREVVVAAGVPVTVSIALRPAALAEQAQSPREPSAAPKPVAAPGAPYATASIADAGAGVGIGIAGGAAVGAVGGVAAPDYRSRSDARRHAPFNTAAYDRIEDNSFVSPRVEPLSTFSIDVDTASYANVRRFLTQGTLPPADAVRIEELVNYFRFDYPQPAADAPFSVTTEVSACPWNPAHRLALIGLQARRLEDRPGRRNLVFLLDVSGSMSPPDRLPLVRTAMRMLVDTLTAQDRIAIVVYAGSSGLVLPTTSGDQKDRIHEAIARLSAGGSTNGASGISLAYKVAQEQFVPGGINRVILATDGDFNVGVTSQGELIRLIEEKRQAGVFLSVLGVGDDNLKDSTMEKLADKGNGNYSYLDTLHEARKVLVAEAGGTLVTVAKDVKIQVEFNPAHVGAYRLIGYENRLLRREDFNDDRKDAGEIGAGHTVTAVYEIVPPGAMRDLPAVDSLKYQKSAGPGLAGGSSNDLSHELMTVKLRYKAPDGDTSKLMTHAVGNRTAPLSDNLGFAAAVAELGMLLRSSEHKGTSSYRDAAALARAHRGRDESGYRAEFIRLVELASALSRQTRSEPGQR